MSRRQPSPPSHLTRAMAQRHMNRALVLDGIQIRLTKTNVLTLAKRGHDLEAELWDGTLMIPRWRIMAYLEKLRATVEGRDA